MAVAISCCVNVVHPHARGEDFRPSRTCIHIHGSPPRTWGRPRRPGKRKDRRWFTPTHVGKTLMFVRTPLRISVHPHARGEDNICKLIRRILHGSPPRTWGRLAERNCLYKPQRFTPTHVGKTLDTMKTVVDYMVHPHARGEDGSLWIVRHPGRGSPPRTWGRRRTLSYKFFLLWFTPTHVGKTSKAALTGFARTVHPHARGEDQTRVSESDTEDGSPPRTWGRHQFILSVSAARWFTPTHVGKTPHCFGVVLWVVVHPHARGEDVARSPFDTGSNSVHPHARGEDTSAFCCL